MEKNERIVATKMKENEQQGYYQQKLGQTLKEFIIDYLIELKYQDKKVIIYLDETKVFEL